MFKGMFNLAMTIGARIASLVSVGSKIRARFGMSGFSTDGETINIVGSPFARDPEWVKVVMAGSNHELAHVRYTDFSVPSGYPCRFPQKVVHDLAHGFEDPRVEYRLIRDLPGTRLTFVDGESVSKERDTLKHANSSDLLMSATLYGIFRKSTQLFPERDLSDYFDESRKVMLDSFGDKIMERVDALLDSYAVDSMSTWDSYEFSEKYLDILQYPENGNGQSDQNSDSGSSDSSDGSQGHSGDNQSKNDSNSDDGNSDQSDDSQDGDGDKNDDQSSNDSNGNGGKSDQDDDSQDGDGDKNDDQSSNDSNGNGGKSDQDDDSQDGDGDKNDDQSSDDSNGNGGKSDQDDDSQDGDGDKNDDQSSDDSNGNGGESDQDDDSQDGDGDSDEDDKFDPSESIKKLTDEIDSKSNQSASFTNGDNRYNDTADAMPNDSSPEAKGGRQASSTDVDYLPQKEDVIPADDPESCHGSRALMMSDDLSALLEAKSMRHRQIGMLEGRIDLNAVHRIAMGEHDVFYCNNCESDGGETLVGILLDLSSSMSSHQLKIQAEAASLLVEALDGIPNVESYVVGMSYTGCSIDQYKHYVAKRPGEDLRIAQRKIAGLQSGGGTPLVMSTFSLCQDMLAEDGFEKHVGVVITDGDYPSEYRDRFAMMEESVDLFGVGIGADLSGLFSHHVNIDNVDELPRTLVGMMTRYFESK